MKPPLYDALHIAAGDNVATALRDLEPGDTVRVKGTEDRRQITSIAHVPRCHKIATAALAAGALVIKYGAPIGRMKRDAAPGEHIHVHNLVSLRGQHR